MTQRARRTETVHAAALPSWARACVKAMQRFELTVASREPAPVVFNYAEGRFLLPCQEFAFARHDPALKRHDVLEGVRFEILSRLRLRQPGK